MSTSVLERPSLAQPVVTGLPCEERKVSAPDAPANWICRMVLKSYISSLHFCLSELGWVPQRILEVGSGDGTMLSYVAQTFMNAEVVGVEFDADKVALAKERNCCRIEFMELSDAETLPFESDSFDLVISHGFLGHSPLPRYWTKEMARVTAEGLIISTPMPWGYQWLQKLPGAKKAKLLGAPVFSPEVQPIAVQQVKNWVERAGLNVETLTMPLPYSMMMARKPQH